jgi:UDP-glucose 4-epimerase
MNVLVTGGAGFIGSHLCDLLLDRGHSITVLDNFSTGSTNNLKSIINRIRIVDSDIGNEEVLVPLIIEASVVLHMAAAVGVRTIIDHPIKSINTNFIGSELIIRNCARYKKRIILASTSEIYGKNPNQPLKESDDRVVGNPQILRWTYSDAKALEESVAHAYFLYENLPVTTIRLFNTVGPRQTGSYGMVIPNFVKSALESRPIQIYGSGEQTRVFCHVTDVVECIELLMKNEKTIGRVYNIGGTEEISINDLANRVLYLTGSNSDIFHIPYLKIFGNTFEDIER